MTGKNPKQTVQMTFTVWFGVPVLLRLHFSLNRSQIAQLYVTSYIKSALKEHENATYPHAQYPLPSLRYGADHRLPAPQKALAA